MARALITVLFTDIVGSTALRSSRGDDETDSLVAHHDRVVTGAVRRHGGHVVKFLGDGAMATFVSAGAALEAACDVVAELGTEPPVRVGVHAGDVAVHDDDVSGLPVAIASRLCDVAPVGGVVVSGLVRSLAGTRSEMTFHPLGTPALKGVSEAVDAWLVGGAEDAVTSTPTRSAAPTLGRRRGPFVGRSEPLDRLNTALRDLERQHLIAVSGEPGIGKTALVGHWAAGAHQQGATVLVGSAPPEGVAPYQPFIEAMRPMLRSDPTLRPRGPGVANLARLMPELTAASTRPPLLDDPRTERYVINEAFVEALDNAAHAHSPLVLILDDLHWADEASVVLLGHLLRHPDDVAVLVVGTYRDTDLHRRHPLSALLRDLRRERRAERIDIVGLDLADVGELIEATTGGFAPPEALDAIFSETEGNPFFVEEILEHLVAEGLVVNGAWEFDPSAPLAIPEGVRDAIGRRLDRLSERAQSLLAAASVVGATFDADILVEILDSPVEDTETALDEALAAGFLIAGEASSVSFAHALIRQALLDELSHLRRTRLHRSVGAALEAAGAPPERLVHHWIEAQDLPRALGASFAAMRDAVAVAAQSAVIQHADTVLALWDEVAPDELPAGAHKHDAIVAAGMARGISLGGAEGVEFLQAQRASLEDTGDDTGLGVVLTEEARHLWPLGRVDEALRAAERAIDLIPAEPPTSERARAEAQLGRLLMLNGRDMERAVEVTRRALETTRAAGDSYTETAVLATLGALESDPVKGESLLRRGLEMAIAQNAAFQVVRARSNLSEMLTSQGRHDDAIEVIQEGVDQAGRLGLHGQSYDWLIVVLAEKLYGAGRWDEAAARLEGETAVGYPESVKLALSAQIAVHRGRFDEARSFLDRLADRYGHITDVQAQSPLATTRMWMARWTADTTGIGHEVFALTLSDAGRTGGARPPTIGFLFAASELASWAASTQRRQLVGPERFDSWERTAELIAGSGPGQAIRATLRAQRARFEGHSRPDLWSEAANAWNEGSFEEAIVVLGWLSSSPDAVDEALSSAAARATATAERLAAEPLRRALAELRP